MLMDPSPSVVSANPPPTGIALPPIEIGITPQNTVIVNPESGATHIENPDGSVSISFGKDVRSESGDELEFGDNLADEIDESVLNMMADDILRGIEEDERSRREWDETYSRGIDLLGLKLDDPSSDVSAQGSISKVHHPLLLEAVVRYQATASAELLPSSGPVKARDDEPLKDPKRIELAEAFEKDYNHYLTVVAKEYYPDFRRMLFAQGFCGNGFKKIYHCPLRRRPVSDYVAAKDLIVSNDVVSLSNAARITHRTIMRHSILKRLQLNGHFRKVTLGQPNSQPTNIDKKIGSVEGIDKSINIPADQPYTIYECYTEYDIDGFNHKDDEDEETGLPLPYRITIEKDSRKILEVRRNYREDDPEFMPILRFVHYGFIPGLGFYHYGFVHLLGQTARALTAIERQLIDAGQFSNFPGLLLSDVGGRQETTQIRVPPGGAHVIKTGGMPIGQVVMPLPYKEPSGVLVNIAKEIQENGRRLGSTAEVNVGEGRADVPVGTAIALIEQGTKVMGAVHKMNHESQTQEFIMLKELFAEEPEALWKFARNPARKWQQSEEFEDVEMVPAADPNTPSHIHRVMQATALGQLFSIFGPDMNRRAVVSIILTTLGYSPTAILNPAGTPTPQGDPAKMAKIAIDKEKIQEKAVTTQINTAAKIKQKEMDLENDEKERQSRERIQEMKSTVSIVQQKNQTDSQAQQQARQHRADRVQQILDHQHEKEVAESESNMLSSEKP